MTIASSTVGLVLLLSLQISLVSPYYVWVLCEDLDIYKFTTNFHNVKKLKPSRQRIIQYLSSLCAVVPSCQPASLSFPFQTSHTIKFIIIQVYHPQYPPGLMCICLYSLLSLGLPSRADDECFLSIKKNECIKDG